MTDAPFPTIPGFDLTARIGAGGMGEVYAARDRAFDRDVAVKTVQPHLTAGPGVELFDREARLTAGLIHPAIPPVYARGSTADGRPFLAMKLIRGRTLDDELRGRAAPAADLPRFVAAFEQIAQAVGYAHSQGVIHRDLKPANVMVGAFAEVQVMDWGLAKRVGGAGADTPAPDARRTADGQPKGTPAFMPPEQARGAWDEVDARADVFALGGILCDILTGDPPFTQPGYFGAIHQSGRGDVADAFARLDGCGADADLVALCKRCLAPAAADRPADGAAVAAEVAAYRAAVAERAREADNARAAADERVRTAEAERAAAVARAGEERQRRRVWYGVTAAALVGAAAAAGFAWWAVREADRATGQEGKTRQALETVTEERNAKEAALAAVTAERNAKEAALAAVTAERNAKEKARAEAERQTRLAIESGLDTEAFSYFLYRGFLTPPRPKGRQLGVGIDVKYLEVLEQAEGIIDRHLAVRPKAEATARHHIGVTWRNLGDYKRAEPLIRRRLELREREYGPDHPETCSCLNTLGVLLGATGRSAEAEQLLRRALAGWEKHFGPDKRDTLVAVHNLGSRLTAQKNYVEAEKYLRRAVEAQTRNFGLTDHETLRSRNSLALLLESRGDRPAAERLYRDILATHAETPDPDNSEILQSYHNLGVLLDLKGDSDEAEDFLKKAVAGRERVLSPDHPETLRSVNSLGACYQNRKDFANAEPLRRRAADGRKKVLGPIHQDTLRSQYHLALILRHTQRTPEAVTLLRQVLAVQMKEKEFGPVHVETRRTLDTLATIYEAAGNPAAAEPLLRQLIAGVLMLPKTNERYVAHLRVRHAAALRNTTRYAEAVPVLEAAVAGRQKEYGPDHPLTLQATLELGICHREAGNAHHGAPYWKTVLDLGVGPDPARPQAGRGTLQIAADALAVYHKDAGHAIAAARYAALADRFAPLPVAPPPRAVGR